VYEYVGDSGVLYGENGWVSSDYGLSAYAGLGNGAKQAMISTFQFWLVFLMSFTKDREEGFFYVTARKFLAGIVVLIAAFSYGL
jgi:hypothetical protein